eukprot:4228574-Ditylum_brightwellii.AAC.1
MDCTTRITSHTITYESVVPSHKLIYLDRYQLPSQVSGAYSCSMIPSFPLEKDWFLLHHLVQVEVEWVLHL